MSEADERTRAQLTDLFQKTEKLTERITKTESDYSHLKEDLSVVKATIELLKAICDKLEKAHTKAHMFLFGDSESGTKGVLLKTEDNTKTTGKHEKIIWKALFVLGVIAYLAKGSGILSLLKLIN